MAIVVANPFGELRGKLGGIVFSAVAGRKVARSYSIPVQPRSLAQVTARAQFGSASQAYHALTDIQKTMWASYAKTIFNAKDQYNVGQWSGSNAFVSLRNLVNQSSVNGIAMNIEDDAGSTLDGTSLVYSYTNEPPVDQLQVNIATNVSGESCGLSIGSAVIADDGSFEIVIDFENCPVTGLGQDTTQDAVGNEYGFAVYVSEVLNQDHNFVKNPAAQLLGVMPGVTGGTTNTLSTSKSLKLVNDNPLSITKYKNFGHVGEQLEAKVYLVGLTGMIGCVGSTKITLSAGT